MDRSISVDTIHMSHSDSRQHDDTNWHDEAAQICMSKSPKKLQLELETQCTYRCSQRATWSEEVTLLAKTNSGNLIWHRQQAAKR